MLIKLLVFCLLLFISFKFLQLIQFILNGIGSFLSKLLVFLFCFLANIFIKKGDKIENI